MSKILTNRPKLRAEKTTPNRDDFKVMISGVLVCIFILLTQKPLYWIYDAAITEQQIIEVLIEIKQNDSSDLKGNTKPFSSNAVVPTSHLNER